MSLIEPKHSLFKIRDGRYLVPVELSTDEHGKAMVGLASSPDVDSADEEVVWTEAQLESTSLQSQGITWVIRVFFGHTFACGAVRWTVTNTREPNSAGVRELELEREGGASSARTRRALRRIQDFLKGIISTRHREKSLRLTSSTECKKLWWRTDPPRCSRRMKQALQRLGVISKKEKEVEAAALRTWS